MRLSRSRCGVVDTAVAEFGWSACAVAGSWGVASDRSSGRTCAMVGVPIGHAPVPTDQQDLTVRSGETNDEVDDPRRRRGLIDSQWRPDTWRPMRCRRRCFTRTVLKEYQLAVRPSWMRRPQTGPSKGPNEVLTARVVFLSGDPCPRVGPGAYNHEVRPRHRRHAYRCRAGVLPCPGPRTARRRSELNATPRLPATAQATTLTQSNPFPRSATGSAWGDPKCGGCDCCCAFGCARGGGSRITRCGSASCEASADDLSARRDRFHLEERGSR